MDRKSIFTKFLAVAGTGLVWFPILAPGLFGLGGLIRGGVFRFDYLMPAEFFPAALAGGGLLLWAALRARARRRLVGWGVGLAAALLVGSQVLALASGLDSGVTEPGGWAWALVLGGLAGYVLALIVLGVGGILLLGDLFRPAQQTG